MDSGCHDQGGAFNSFDRVHIVLNCTVRDRLRKTMRRCDDNVKSGITELKSSGFRDGIQQIKSCVLLALLVVTGEAGSARRRQQRLLCPFAPKASWGDDCRSQCAVWVQLLKPFVQLLWNLREVSRCCVVRSCGSLGLVGLLGALLRRLRPRRFILWSRNGVFSHLQHNLARTRPGFFLLRTFLLHLLFYSCFGFLPFFLEVVESAHSPLHNGLLAADFHQLRA
mmetsp:Transcript_22513/g.53085  ORF Transcript_22513/g.53085 Transcript_22513/m.53085 type:complete len:224 (+) Transcript_22513:159-830(+)